MRSYFSPQPMPPGPTFKICHQYYPLQQRTTQEVRTGCAKKTFDALGRAFPTQVVGCVICKERCMHPWATCLWGKPMPSNRAVSYLCERIARGVRFLTQTPAIGVSMRCGTLAGEVPEDCHTPPLPWNTPRCCGAEDVHGACDEMIV